MIVVTGGKGFLGTQLVKRLAHEGPVTSVVRGDTYEQKGNCLEIGCDHVDLTDVLHQASIFIHAAGKLHGNWDELKTANVDTVRFYLDRLPNHLQQVIAFSSVNVFIWQDDDYGRSKWLAEEAWRSSPFADRLTLLRPSWIYGPQDTHNLYSLLHRLQQTPWLFLLPGNAHVRPVFIDDVIALTVRLVHQGEKRPGTYLLAGKQAVSWQELVEYIAPLLGKRIECLVIPDQLVKVLAKIASVAGVQQATQRLTRFSIDKLWYEESAWQILGRELTDLQRGMRQSVEYYLQSKR